jgi:hypothetical protein
MTAPPLPPKGRRHPDPWNPSSRRHRRQEPSVFDQIVEEIKAERRAKRKGYNAPTVIRVAAPAGRAAAHETWFCRAPHCRNWTSNGAYLTGNCNHCGTPKPSTRNASIPTA